MCASCLAHGYHMQLLMPANLRQAEKLSWKSHVSKYALFELDFRHTGADSIGITASKPGLHLPDEIRLDGGMLQNVWWLVQAFTTSASSLRPEEELQRASIL